MYVTTTGSQTVPASATLVYEMEWNEEATEAEHREAIAYFAGVKRLPPVPAELALTGADAVWFYDRQTDYLAAARIEIVEGPDNVRPWLTLRCTECGHIPDAGDTVHTLSDDGYVLIGCEGYWLINPARLGLDAGQWQDWRN